MLIFLHLAVPILTRCAIAVAHAHMHRPIRARLTKIGCKITSLKYTPLRISVFYSLKGVIGGALFFQFRFYSPRTPFISLCVITGFIFTSQETAQETATADPY